MSTRTVIACVCATVLLVTSSTQAASIDTIRTGFVVMDSVASSIPFMGGGCIDNDGDGYGQFGDISCTFGGSDCNDFDISIHPGAVEIPDNGIDEDCNGFDTVTCIVDSDGDGFGTSAGTVILSDDGDCNDAGESTNNLDCDDSNASVNPSAVEIDCNGVDENCDGSDGGTTDFDNDGFSAICDGDCNDFDVNIHPGAVEIPDNGVDEDCNGFDTVTCIVDSDGDGFGTSAGTVILSDDGDCNDAGESTNNLDCDDSNASVNPSAVEIDCNGIDEDCDGSDACVLIVPPLPDPNGPGDGFQCDDQGVDTYGLNCSRCNGGSRDGNPCIDDSSCSGGFCVADHSICAGGSCNVPLTWPKNRYIGFSVPESMAGVDVAVRVKLLEVDGFPQCNGEVRWVGSPAKHCEGAVCVEANKFWASPLQSTPLFMDWTTVDVVQVYGEEIIPSSRYAIQLVDSGCVDLNDENCYSTVLIIETAKWGDVIRPMFPFTSATQPTVADVLSCVDKWLGALQPLKVRSQIQPQIPNADLSVGIADVLRDVDAWLGSPYPFSVTTCE